MLQQPGFNGCNLSYFSADVTNFFLAMKTNVGYSPVATFIVQMEDTASISEALGKIKNYLVHENICIKNFMIDCSPMEMQSLKETFPNAVFM